VDKKEVKIIGLSINESLGIVKACKLAFDENNRLIVMKGSTGQGKTTIQKALQLGTQGSKTLIDKDLYGEIDTEVQLLDGNLNLWIGCKSKDGKLDYILYTKDENGKKVKNPIVDGVSATPSKYLEALQTELTWRMDELTSENPTVQKTILLKLYQYQLQKIGVIFDKKHPDYGTSILGLIEAAEGVRNFKDTIRKQKGGIADDLKANGYDPDRPETIPSFINTETIQEQIKEQERLKTTKIAQAELLKNNRLSEIVVKGSELKVKCLEYNKKLKKEYDLEIAQSLEYEKMNNKYQDLCLAIESFCSIYLDKNSFKTAIEAISIKSIQIVIKPNEPQYIKFENDQIDLSSETTDPEALRFLEQVSQLRNQYILQINLPADVDTLEFDNEIEKLKVQILNAVENNKVVYAVQSFHEWREANEEVVQLKDEYVKLLAQVNTGVQGLTIVPVENDIFLMYNGFYDPQYFGNSNLEMRKLSSYSGTQKPVICLLIQNYLLNQKPKAMRYLYIDNIPIDKKTRDLIEQMAESLNLRIFLNITGDFDKSNLNNGEILVEGGEVFFNEN
jgi:hypothetical protein